MLSLKINSFQRIPRALVGLCIVLTLIPGFFARLDMYYIDDMIWFLVLFPCYIFSYYLGFAGGFLAAVVVNVYHTIWYLYEKYIRIAEIIDIELSLHVGVAIVTVLCALGVGLLSEKLTEKQVQLQSLNRELKQAALYDSLTNLPNRLYFMEKLSRTLQSKRFVSLMFIDLDGFKMVNDTLGHEQGDHILQAVAIQLQTFVNDTTFASRLGGDEFVVMAVEADQEKVTKLATDILSNLQLKVNHLTISASIGIARSQQDDTPSTLLKRADTAMYHIKSTGKNAVG